MILSTKQKQTTATESRLVFPSGEGVGWTGSSGFLDRYKLLHLEWMGSGALLYSTGHCVSLGHFAVQQNLKKHCESTIL